MYNDIILLIFAIFVGILAGIIGIGGGIILVPFLIYFNYTIQQAVAISLFLNTIPNALPALYLYYNNGHFLLRPAIICALGSITGMFFGGYIGSKKIIPDKYIYRFYSALLILMSFYLLYYYCELF